MSTIAARDQLVIPRHRNVEVVDDRALRRAAASGAMQRLLIGAYVPTEVWESLSKDGRHRLVAAAAAEVHPGFVASHRTAAALWRMPTIGRGDGLVHSRTTVAAGTRTEHGYRKHAVAAAELHLCSIDGVLTTTLERTVVDLALTERFESAVVAADWALTHGASKESLRTALDELSPRQGRARVEAVIAFADGDSGSAGESYSRVLIVRAGLPAPLLQVRFDDHRGLIGFVDFYWPEFRLIDEFDGLEKYSNAQYSRGRTPSEVVTDEKIREDRLRAASAQPSVTRWVWATVHERGALATQLRLAGLPTLR